MVYVALEQKVLRSLLSSFSASRVNTLHLKNDRLRTDFLISFANCKVFAVPDFDFNGTDFGRVEPIAWFRDSGWW